MNCSFDLIKIEVKKDKINHIIHSYYGKNNLILTMSYSGNNLIVVVKVDGVLAE